MEIETCRFIRLQMLFKGCDAAKDKFADSDPGFTWGDNNRSLVDRDSMIDAIVEITCDDDVEDELRTVIERLKRLPADVYIDLEN